MDRIGKLTDKQRKAMEDKRKQALSNSKQGAKKKSKCSPAKKKNMPASNKLTEAQVYIMLEILAEETKQKIKNEFKMR